MSKEKKFVFPNIFAVRVQVFFLGSFSIIKNAKKGEKPDRPELMFRTWRNRLVRAWVNRNRE